MIPSRTSILILIIGAALTLSACVTARIHPEAELSAVGRTCGLSEGELVQEAELKKVLFLYRVAPTRRVQSCVYQWAHKNHLHLAVIEAVNFPQQ
jgi:hypothetical protein